jgi:hypothetical protein
MVDEPKPLYERRAYRPNFAELAGSMDEAALSDVAEVDLGIEIQQFLSQDAGKFLAGRAQQMYDDATEKLALVNAADTQAVIALQVQARAAWFFITWCAEAIRNGNEARNRIDQQGDQPHDHTFD